jgi:hypothetical protein
MSLKKFSDVTGQEIATNDVVDVTFRIGVHLDPILDLTTEQRDWHLTKAEAQAKKPIADQFILDLKALVATFISDIES